MTPTRTGTRSQTGSQTSSGFPLTNVLDNSGSLLCDTDLNAAYEISPNVTRGVAMYWPEVDPYCGVGRYMLARYTILISVPASSATLFQLTAQIYSTQNGTWQPEVLLASQVFYVATGSARPYFYRVRT